MAPDDLILLGYQHPDSKRGPVRLDLQALISSRMLLQANSGAGKSWALRRLLEQTYGRIQQIVLDYDGEFPSLREKFDYILAGKDRDIPAHPQVAKMLARKLLETEASAIIDIYDLVHAERMLFMRIFLESLVEAPKSLWHPVLIVIDEAQEFAPESGRAESREAVNRLLEHGRKRGFCPVLATQRIAELSKGAAAACVNKVIGRANLENDKIRAARELGSRTYFDLLPRLAPGSFYAYGPAISQDVVQFTMGPVATTHPDVTTRQTLNEPPPPSSGLQAILAGLADLPKEAEREARDLSEANSRIRDLTKKLQVAQRPQPAQPAQPSGVAEADVRRRVQEATSPLREQLVERDREVKSLTKLVDALDSHLKSARGFVAVRIDHAITAIEKHKEKQSAEQEGQVAPAPVIDGLIPHRPCSVCDENRDSWEEDGGAGRRPRRVNTLTDIETSQNGVSGPQQRILDALAAFAALGSESVPRGVIAVYSGAGSRSSGYRANVSTLRARGLLDYPRDGYLCLTPDGRDVAQDSIPVPGSREDIHQLWFNHLSGPQAAILRVLIRAYPDALTRETVAEASGASAASSGYRANVSRLRTLGLLTYPSDGLLCADPELLWLDRDL